MADSLQEFLESSLLTSHGWSDHDSSIIRSGRTDSRSQHPPATSSKEVG